MKHVIEQHLFRFSSDQLIQQLLAWDGNIQSGKIKIIRIINAELLVLLFFDLFLVSVLFSIIALSAIALLITR